MYQKVSFGKGHSAMDWFQMVSYLRNSAQPFEGSPIKTYAKGCCLSIILYGESVNSKA